LGVHKMTWRAQHHVCQVVDKDVSAAPACSFGMSGHDCFACASHCSSVLQGCPDGTEVVEVSLAAAVAVGVGAIPSFGQVAAKAHAVHCH